jgi:tRNA threonylcarbamoyl adenosine modification protein YeaZ/ribosomal-protein-alanine acetyltransferase
VLDKGEVDNREYNIAAMVILALETVTRAGSLAIQNGHRPAAATTGDASRTHGVRLPGELIAFAASHGLAIRDIDCFAVVTGPGSFTGLRIGLATVQGLALAHHRPVIGIPTLEAIASGWIDEHPERDGILVACMDAARGDVFYAAYDVTGASAIEGARPLTEPRVASPEVAAREVAVLRRGDRPIVIAGTGVERHASAFVAAMPGAVVDAGPLNLAAAAARLAARRVATATPPHALRPVYVRRPDAELARERAGLAPPSDAPARSSDEPAWTIVDVRTPGEVAAVARLQERSFGNAWGAEALAGGLTNPNIARLYAVRLRSAELVAYCACWQVVDELHINSLAVDPAHRRRGIAKSLLAAVMAAAAAAGAASATLEVRESNRAGRALYEGLGFRIEGVRRDYYENPREDALVLWHRALG